MVRKAHPPCCSAARRTCSSRSPQTPWRTDADKEALLEQLKAQDLKPLEAIPLIWHSDGLVRKLGVDFTFMAKPNAEAVRAWC
ncbi:MAG: hypothetical protein IPN01_14825 [Deltaproteobacteria bacterium]|nr:hypothetical protein [Deltaproteobacteria bacterium]